MAAVCKELSCCAENLLAEKYLVATATDAGGGSEDGGTEGGCADPATPTEGETFFCHGVAFDPNVSICCPDGPHPIGDPCDDGSDGCIGPGCVESPDTPPDLPPEDPPDDPPTEPPGGWEVIETESCCNWGGQYLANENTSSHGDCYYICARLFNDPDDPSLPGLAVGEQTPMTNYQLACVPATAGDGLGFTCNGRYFTMVTDPARPDHYPEGDYYIVTRAA